MEAARGLLQPEDYQAIVEERGLDGLCGYPPCCHDAVGTSEGKKWSLDRNRYTVHKTNEVGNFCSTACQRASHAFATGLDPDPAYIRPASAVDASRGAIAADAKSPAAAPAA